ncbi:MAG TPA: hypothetical protein ENJ43_01605 [Gammaproteobacteria bacterium]|nr:hypothetical protein [Gammaproteobacteria bacterium]
MLTERQRSRIRACCKDEQGFATIMEIIQAERKELERAKTDFFSEIGHELRTPLTTIQGTLSLLAREVPGPLPQRAREMVERAIENSIKLRDLINYFIDLQRLQSGSAELRLQPVDLYRLLDQALSNLRPFAARRQIRLILDEDSPRVRVEADPDRLAQVISNLLSNAIKFSPSNSTITVQIDRCGATGRFSISDQGPGIPPEIQQRLFRRFVKANTADQRQAGGSGLGLNICKAIVEGLDGRIWFTTAAGSGTTFHVELPAATPHPAPAPEQDEATP